MSVELRELRYFVALAEELNFTRAAARLHLAQQGLSMAIRQMEQRLGGALFDRSTRSVGLTAAGEALVPHAREALAAADAGQAAVRAVMRGERGHLRIGFCAIRPARTALLSSDLRSTTTGWY